MKNWRSATVSAGSTIRQAMEAVIPGNTRNQFNLAAQSARQAGSTFSSSYVEQCVVANAGIARLLIALFETRHDPALSGDRTAQAWARKHRQLRSQLVHLIDERIPPEHKA